MINVANGDVVTTNNRLSGSTATYTCNAGLFLEPTGTRTCQTNGMWTGFEPQCLGKYA